jgi:NAD+ synthase
MAERKISEFPNVSSYEIDLTQTFETFRHSIPATAHEHQLSMANTRSRLRMVTLYAIGQSEGLLVTGTGNKIEDFGVGFYTKYGDGGVDISPIADLTKTEVYTLAAEMEIVNSIQNAPPTDGLWETDRCDEDQLGATYPELEWAMQYINSNSAESVSSRQKTVLEIYRKFNRANKHKMVSIPVCFVPQEMKTSL